MAELKNLSVLITHESFDTASRLTSVLDNSGYKIRAHQVSSKDEIANELKNNTIDIVLAQQESTSPSPKDLLQEINRLNKDIPVILISTTYDGNLAAQGIRLGAKDVVAVDEDQHLVMVVGRELANREERARHRDIQRKFYASENRYQQLLRFARLPMAIVHESTFVLVNDAFAELFGIPQEEIELQPAIDILDKKAQGTFKDIYKKFAGAPQSFNGAEMQAYPVTANGQPMEVKIELNAVKFNNQDCLQMRIEPQGAFLPSGGFEPEEATGSTGLLPRHKLVQHINSCINVAHQDGRDASLLCIEIDGFQHLQETLGLGDSDRLYHALIEFVRERHNAKPLTNFETNQLMLLLEGVGAEEALETARNLCVGIEEHIFEFDQHSNQITCTIGISLISDLITNADTVVKQALKACDQLRENAKTEAVNSAGLYEPEATASSEEIDINYLLKQAFKHSHLQILFQPLLKFHGEEGKNYEVLLGTRPEHKDAYPPDFIAMATRSNENHEIDRWVILEALRTLMKKANCSGDECLFIHVSKQSLQNPQFAAWLAAAIKKSRIPPRNLVFQFREVDVSSHLKVTAELVKAIKNMGCRTAITHFGSSVQPMKILDGVEFDFVKVDGTFAVSAQNGNPNELHQLLAEIKTRGRQSIVPMVESATILPSLWKSSVAYIQGYYVRSPSDKMDFNF